MDSLTPLAQSLIFFFFFFNERPLNFNYPKESNPKLF